MTVDDARDSASNTLKAVVEPGVEAWGVMRTMRHTAKHVLLRLARTSSATGSPTHTHGSSGSSADRKPTQALQGGVGYQVHTAYSCPPQGAPAHSSRLT